MKDKPIADLALAAFLSTIGHKFHSLTHSGNKVNFIFESSEKIQNDIFLFYNRSATVDPLTFAETLRNFKALALRA